MSASENLLPFDPQPKQEVLVRARFINRATNKLWSWVRIEGADAPVAVYSKTLVSATEYAKAALDSAEQSKGPVPISEHEALVADGCAEQPNGSAPTLTQKQRDAIHEWLDFSFQHPTDEALDAATESLAAAIEGARDSTEQALRPTPRSATITVNMREHQVEGGTISYEQIAELAGKPNATNLTMTYHWVSPERKAEISGSLIPGEYTLVRDGMHFCATNTSNA